MGLSMPAPIGMAVAIIRGRITGPADRKQELHEGTIIL